MTLTALERAGLERRFNFAVILNMSTWRRFMRTITGILFSLLVLLMTCATSWSYSVGAIELTNVVPPDPSTGVGGDQISIFNYTGNTGGDLLDPLIFSNVLLKINGTQTALNDIAVGGFDVFPADGLTYIPTTSIFSLFFSANIGTAPLTVNLVGGGTDLISQLVTYSYNGNGLALDPSNDPMIIDAPPVSGTSPVPEPGTLLLLGAGLGALLIGKRRRA
jgi:hypothetical protein